MKKILVILILLVGAVAHAQFVPPPGAMYMLSGSTWVPNTNASSYAALSFTPPPVAMYCENTSHQWVPCTSGGGGGGNISGSITHQTPPGIITASPTTDNTVVQDPLWVDISDGTTQTGFEMFRAGLPDPLLTMFCWLGCTETFNGNDTGYGLTITASSTAASIGFTSSSGGTATMDGGGINSSDWFGNTDSWSIGEDGASGQDGYGDGYGVGVTGASGTNGGGDNWGIGPEGASGITGDGYSWGIGGSHVGSNDGQAYINIDGAYGLDTIARIHIDDETGHNAYLTVDENQIDLWNTSAGSRIQVLPTSLSLTDTRGNNLTLNNATGCTGTPGAATLTGSSNGEAFTIPINCL